MPHCVMRWCTNHARKTNKADGITFHTFPSKKHGETRQQWIEIVRKQRSEEDWTPSNFSRVCSIHFDIENKYMTHKGRVKIKNTAVPTIKVGKRDGQTTSVKAPQTPWQDPDTSDHEAANDDSSFTVPLLSRLEQCRFCGDFSKECLHITENTPYVTDNKTAFTFNGISINLDFNDDSLPKTVCHDCDVKLQEIADFVNVVKAAQDSLINVADEQNQDGSQGMREDIEGVGEDIEGEREDIEGVTKGNALVVKIEYEPPTYDDNNVNDVDNNKFNDTDGDGVNDINETESRKVNETCEPSFTNKRKGKVVGGTKLKKAKVTKVKESTIEDESVDNEVKAKEDEELDFLVEEKKLKVIKDEQCEINNEVKVKEESIENTDRSIIDAVQSILMDTENIEPGVS